MARSSGGLLAALLATFLAVAVAQDTKVSRGFYAGQHRVLRGCKAYVPSQVADLAAPVGASCSEDPRALCAAKGGSGFFPDAANGAQRALMEVQQPGLPPLTPALPAQGARPSSSAGAEGTLCTPRPAGHSSRAVEQCQQSAPQGSADSAQHVRRCYACPAGTTFAAAGYCDLSGTVTCPRAPQPPATAAPGERCCWQGPLARRSRRAAGVRCIQSAAVLRQAGGLQSTQPVPHPVCACSACACRQPCQPDCGGCHLRQQQRRLDHLWHAPAQR